MNAYFKHRSNRVRVTLRLTSLTDYGLRMLTRMANAPDRAFSTAALADEFGLSRHHLTKIMQRLGQGGIVTTRRAGGGGATLARDPQTISVGAIVRLREEGQPLVDCFAATGGDCTLTGCGRLKALLRSAEAAFMADLDRSTLADIALPAAPLLRNGRSRGLRRSQADLQQRKGGSRVVSARHRPRPSRAVEGPPN